jgi:hypothetical protein
MKEDDFRAHDRYLSRETVLAEDRPLRDGGTQAGARPREQARGAATGSAWAEATDARAEAADASSEGNPSVFKAEVQAGGADPGPVPADAPQAGGVRAKVSEPQEEGRTRGDRGAVRG